MRRVSRRSGSALVGAAVAGVLLTASVSWACNPLIGPQWEFIVTPTANPGEEPPVGPTSVGTTDSGPRNANVPLTVEGYLTGVPTYGGATYGKDLFLGSTNVASLLPLTANNNYCGVRVPGNTATYSNALIGDDTLVVTTVDTDTRSVVQGTGMIPANTRTTAGVYVACAGAQVDRWYDTVTLV